MRGLISKRGALPACAALLVLLFGAVAEWAAWRGDVWSNELVLLDATVGVATTVAGAIAWAARPASRVGPVLVAVGALWFPGAFGYGRNQALVDFVGFPLQGWHEALLVALLVAISAGGLRDPWSRLIVGGGLGAHAVLSLARLLLRPPLDPTSCFCVGNRLTGIVEPDAYETAVRIGSAVEAGFACAALVLLTVRWSKTRGAARRQTGFLLGVGALAVAVVVANRIVFRVLRTPAPSSELGVALMAGARLLIPVALVASLIRGSRARGRVADVVIELDDRGAAAGTVTLRKALADPGVELLRFEHGRYVDTAGRPAELPPPGAPLAATVLEREGTPLGAIVHDAALIHEPELLHAVRAAARLALDNERLTAQLRERLVEVESSRRRIVEAAEDERRRLERDLHDDVQQRLVSLKMRLRQLETKASGRGRLELADAVGAMATDLGATIDGIRSIARGVRSPVLAEGGLRAALEALVDRTALVVELDAQIATPSSEAVEAAAFYVASEALANAAKHAEATRVLISARSGAEGLELAIADDGRGGASLQSGGGLEGLLDRVEALGGSLELRSGASGTTIRARFPREPDHRDGVPGADGGSDERR